MLRACVWIALVACLQHLVFSLNTVPSPEIKYKTYAEMKKYLLELNTTFPDVVRVSVAQETYHLPYPKELQCIVDNDTNRTESCKHFVVHLTNHSTLASDPERPEVFFSGALHGNERIGPNAVIELIALFAHATSKYGTNKEVKPTMDTQRWLKELVNTRNVVAIPMTNAYGYSHNVRTELEVDPNRDYNYLVSGVNCMKTMTSRVVNEIWRDHVFQLAVTFHSGTRAVAYEWGSTNHYLNGSSENPSERSPDDMAQFQLGNTLANFAGIFPDGKLYPTGTMNDIVYGVTGGMEDWAYAASWENQFYEGKLQPFRPCEPETFGGYPKEKTIYNNITHRAFNMLVETSGVKVPAADTLGKYEELYQANVDFFRTEKVTTELIGQVPRNVRLALMMIEMVQPFIRWVDAAVSSMECTDEVSSFFAPASLYTESTDQVIQMGCGTSAWKRNEVATCDSADCRVTDGKYSKLQIAWEVLGALTVDSTYVQVSSSPTFDTDTIVIETTAQEGTTRRFYEFASDSSQAAAANANTMGTSLFLTCLDLGNITSGLAYIRAVATVDQDWQTQGDGNNAASPLVPPQSHLVNARTNPDWNLEWNSHRVKSTLKWTSPVMTVDTAKKLQTSAAQVSPFRRDSEDRVDSGKKPGNEVDKVIDETILDDEMKTAVDTAANQGTRLKYSSFDTTQDITVVAAVGSRLDKRNTTSSLLQFGYLIIGSCAMIIVLTLAYLYRRVFQRGHQSYINISSHEQATRTTLNSIDNQEYQVDDNESDDDEGPRIPRHAQSSQSVM